MNFDINETIRQLQRKYVRSIQLENGDLVDVTIVDGNVVVTPVASPEGAPTDDDD